MTSFLLLLASFGQAEAPGEAGPSLWRYVLPTPGDPHEYPPPHALGLLAERPPDLVEKVAYRGRRRRYAQIRFGSPSSTRVTVVLDEAAPGEADLYVDADRNRRIEPRDLVEGRGRTWSLPLDAAFVEGETTRLERRAAIFRLGSTGTTLAFAAAGYREGAVRLADRRRRARLMDGDGDGLVAGSRDRLWIDLDDDGRWDTASEQFPLVPTLELGGDRYAVRTDVSGRRLSLEPLEGAGTVGLSLGRAGFAGRLVDLSALLVGRDGSAVALSGVGTEATVPAGAYRLGSVALTLEDPAGGPRWSYVFSDDGRRGDPVWHEVAKGASIRIDPLGTLDLSTGLEGPAAMTRPGEFLSIRPRLFTSDGLLIVTCYRGIPAAPSSDDGPRAEIALEARDGRTLASGHSGFA